VKSKVRGPGSEVGKLAIVALGSNMGDSRQNVLRGMERLEELADGPVLKSSLWETAPVDCPPGSPVFVNAVVGLRPRSGETPESLLTKLQALEKEFGRRPKKVLNEARPLDLDLIAFAGEVRQGDSLVLPHPRAHERRFVLQPLAEISPDLILPGQRRTAAELLKILPAGESVEKLSS
jgi:2-amino-4-hydroxy-6-hydroxymethyldihydropteridine diphosphokinase